MGVGDDIMATGLARGASSRGKQIAFGDKRRIIWGPHSEVAFRNNPNIARPGSERAGNLEWVEYYKGKRLYNYQLPGERRWRWNPFHPRPGEIFFSALEIERGRRLGNNFILIEPNVVEKKSVARNKTWPTDRYQEVADWFLAAEHRRVVQFCYADMKYTLKGVEHAPTDSFRDAMAILSNASLYIGPEGGLHHAAAAVGVPGVVLFGGFIPPSSTGYDCHINLTGGYEACGSLNDCEHCRKAMDSISVGEVIRAASSFLEVRLVG